MSTPLRELQGLPRKILLSARTWVAAAVLGLLRTAVNDDHRRAVRDRGRSKNLLNDLQGSLGELVGMELLHRAGLGQPASGLLDLEGSVNRPDLVADTSPPTALDVKCHFDEPGKRLFLVNERARIRSIHRGVRAFLPVVTAAWRRHAYVGALIPATQLETWLLGTVGTFHDPARQLPLTRLDSDYLSNQQIRWGSSDPAEQWGPLMVPAASLRELDQYIDAAILARLRRSTFSLDGRSASETRRALIDLLPPALKANLLRMDER